MEHRYAHEFGETSSKAKHKPPISFTKPQQTPRTEKHSKTVTDNKKQSATEAKVMKNKFEEALQKTPGSQDAMVVNGSKEPQGKMATSVTTNVVSNKLQDDQ